MMDYQVIKMLSPLPPPISPPLVLLLPGFVSDESIHPSLIGFLVPNSSETFWFLNDGKSFVIIIEIGWLEEMQIVF